MSSSKRPTSSAASNVDFGDYLDRVYDQNMKESEAAYAAHLKAAKELHQAEVAMMRSKRAVRALNDELAKATATAASATELVDRKRKAADAAADDFEATSRMTRGCYGTEGSAPSSVHRPTSPPYFKVVPVYSKVVDTAKTAAAAPADDDETQLPRGAKVIAVEQESQDPYDGGETPSFNPVSKDYVPQNPCGSPVYHVNSPVGYCRLTGEPIYSPKKGYSATSPTYTPKSPPHAISPHVLAAAKRACLKWGA
jgi:hypothetical protein